VQLGGPLRDPAFGKPEDDPFPDPAFVRDAETSGLAKVFFNQKPKEGRTARGSVAGVLYYEESLSSFDQTVPQGAGFTGCDRRSPATPSTTTMTGSWSSTRSSSTTKPLPDAATGQLPPSGCAGGDPIGFRLFDDRFDRDRMRLSFRNCQGHGSGTYRYTHNPANDQELEIEMSQPKRL
jgi:hypothetical protein